MPRIFTFHTWEVPPSTSRQMPCLYIMEMIIYIKMNNGGLKQNLSIHQHETRQRFDFQTRFCRTNVYKKSVINLGTKLYNKLPNRIKNLENPKLFKNQLKVFLLQQTFYSVDEYLIYNQVKNSLYKWLTCGISVIVFPNFGINILFAIVVPFVILFPSFIHIL